MTARQLDHSPVGHSTPPNSKIKKVFGTPVRQKSAAFAHLLADVDGSHKHRSRVDGERGDHVGHVAHVRAVADVEHVGCGLNVAETEGNPVPNARSEAAQPDGDQPCALRVRDESAERVLHHPLARPEAHADP